RVEPVAAGRLLLPGHQVAGRDPGPGQHRQGGGQEGLLEFGHDAASFRVAALRVGGARQPSQSRLVLVVRSTWHRRLLVPASRPGELPRQGEPNGLDPLCGGSGGRYARPRGEGTAMSDTDKAKNKGQELK